MPTKTKVMSISTIGTLLKSDMARPICTDSIDNEYVVKNPAFQALSKLEQEAWIMHLNGCSNNSICERFKLKPYQATRLLQAVLSKLNYLLRFREILDCEYNMEYKRRFYGVEEDGFESQPFNRKVR